MPGEGFQPLAVYEDSARAVQQNLKEIGYNERLPDKVLDRQTGKRLIYALFAVCACEHDLKIWTQAPHAVEDVPAHNSG